VRWWTWKHLSEIKDEKPQAKVAESWAKAPLSTIKGSRARRPCHAKSRPEEPTYPARAVFRCEQFSPFSLTVGYCIRDF